jgi:hypothetical protein
VADIKCYMPVVQLDSYKNRAGNWVVLAMVRGTSRLWDWGRNVAVAPAFKEDAFLRRGVRDAGVDVKVRPLLKKVVPNFKRKFGDGESQVKYHYGMVYMGVYVYELVKRHVADLRNNNSYVDEVCFYGTSLGGAAAMIAGHLMRASEQGDSLQRDLEKHLDTYRAAYVATLTGSQAGGSDLENRQTYHPDPAVQDDLEDLDEREYTDDAVLGPEVQSDADAYSTLSRAASTVTLEAAKTMAANISDGDISDVDLPSLPPAMAAIAATVRVNVFCPPNYCSGDSDISWSAARISSDSDGKFSVVARTNYRDAVIHSRIAELPGFTYPMKFSANSLRDCVPGFVQLNDFDPRRALDAKWNSGVRLRSFAHGVFMTHGRLGTTYWLHERADAEAYLPYMQALAGGTKSGGGKPGDVAVSAALAAVVVAMSLLG